MKTELFYNIGRWLDDGFEELYASLGEVLLLECKTRDQDAIVMSNNEGGEVVLKLGDIKKCFVVKDKRMLCFVFKKKRVSINGKSCQTLTFLSFPPSRDFSYYWIPGRDSKEEFEISVDFVAKNFNGLRPLSVNSIEDINFHIHGFKFQNSKVLMDSNETMKKLRTWYDEPLGMLNWLLKWKYIALYHSYMKYLHQNSLSARDFKTFIRRSENLPNLFKKEIAIESPKMLWVIVLDFIHARHCQNDYVKRDNCQKVSYLKCSACGFAYYCSKECQTENWPKHKQFCEALRNINMEYGKSRAIINSHVMKQANEIKNQDSPLSFKIFRKEIERALFTAYYDVIAHTNYFDDDLNSIFGKDKEVWLEKLQGLQKKRYKHLKLSSKQLESQLVSVYGTKNVFI